MAFHGSNIRSDNDLPLFQELGHMLGLAQFAGVDLWRNAHEPQRSEYTSGKVAAVGQSLE